MNDDEQHERDEDGEMDRAGGLVAPEDTQQPRKRRGNRRRHRQAGERHQRRRREHDERVHALLQQAVGKLTGLIQQVPPIHSAIKKDGKRVYELARKGKEVKLDPRPVTIHAFELTNIDLPVVQFRVVCSTGTYIRSLANDLGALLGCGGYLSSLCRTRIGDFRLEQAMTIEEAGNYIRESLVRKDN